MLPDAAHIQEKDFEFLQRRDKAGTQSEPLYSLADAVATQDLMVGVPYRRITHLRKHLALEFIDAGHILGSASVDIRITEAGSHRLVFSGDIGRSGLPIVRDPDPPSGPVDTLIIEATYADRSHESVADAEERLGEAVRRVAARGGKVLVPAFALGRAQELIYSLHQLWRARKIPEIPIYVDSPLAVDVTTVFRMHPEVFDQRERLIASESRIFDFPLVRYVRTVEESKALDTSPGPMVIVGGLGHGGVRTHPPPPRARHRRPPQPGPLRRLPGRAHAGPAHQGGRRPGPRSSATSSRCAPRSQSIDGYSAHADRGELLAWVRRLGGPIRRAFVVHGEAPALEAMAKASQGGRGAGRADPPTRRELRPVARAAPTLPRFHRRAWCSSRPASCTPSRSRRC